MFECWIKISLNIKLGQDKATQWLNFMWIRRVDKKGKIHRFWR